MHVDVNISLAKAIEAARYEAQVAPESQLKEKHAQDLEFAAAAIRRRLALKESPPLSVLLPERLMSDEWKEGGGDARKANSKFFQWRYRRDDGGDSDVVVVCPSFLRGPLTFQFMNGSGFVGASY